MRFIFAFIFIVSGFAFAFGQNEQAPIVEKEIGYKDWTYKNLGGPGETNLRQFAKGKKLVMVVYWAPWCPNWRHDVRFVQDLHERFGRDGLAVIGVGEYDAEDRMKLHLQEFKLTFQNVYESTALTDRLTNTHYAMRSAAGDTRKWGSPWYVFLDPSKLQANGEVLASKVSLVNGELIRPDAEKFIREKLGLSPAGVGAVADGGSKAIEVCEPDAKKTALVKP